MVGWVEWTLKNKKIKVLGCVDQRCKLENLFDMETDLTEKDLEQTDTGMTTLVMKVQWS